MLDHKNINVHLTTPYHKGLESKYDHAFLCIPIDEFINLNMEFFRIGQLFLEMSWKIRMNKQHLL